MHIQLQVSIWSNEVNTCVCGFFLKFHFSIAELAADIVASQKLV